VVNARNPYLVSGLGHFGVLMAAAMLSSLAVHRPVVSGVEIVMPPPGDGGPVQAARSQDDLAERGQATPEPEEAQEPAPVPDKKPEPKPEIVPPNKPEPDGALPPVKDQTVPSKRGQVPQQVEALPAAGAQPPVSDPDPVPEKPVTPGPGQPGTQGGGIGVEGGVLGAHAPWYLVQLRDKLASNWRQPASVGRPGVVVAKVHFIVRPDGDVSDVELVESSGNALYDRSVLGSVYNSSPLPPIPEDLSAREIGITVTFEQRY
jgi:TonB family protein